MLKEARVILKATVPHQKVFKIWLSDLVSKLVEVVLAKEQHQSHIMKHNCLHATKRKASTDHMEAGHTG